MDSAIGDIIAIVTWLIRAFGGWALIYGGFILFQNWNDQNPEANRRGISSLIVGVAIIALSGQVSAWLTDMLTINF